MRTRRDAAVAAATFATLTLGRHVAGAQPTTASPPAVVSAAGAVQGVVYDSLTHRRLAGATVQSVRAVDLVWGRTAIADSVGTFRIDSLPPGRYFVGFSDPLLDLLRVDALPRLVELGPGSDVVRVDLGVPALARVWPVVCGSPQAPADSSSLLAGRVRDAADGAAVANAKVVATWSEVVLGTKGVQTEHHRLPVTTGPDGRYVMCGVPAGEELVVTAEASGRASGQVALVLPPLGFVARDLSLGDSVAVVASNGAAARPKRGDNNAAPVARGTARLAGTVRDTVGRPVRGARAFVWGTASPATTDADGAFTLADLPAGTRTLELRAIGFAPRRVPVDLAAGRTAAADVRMEPTPRTLAPVTVFGSPSGTSTRVAEFLDRQRHNAFGRFVTAADIERRHDYDVTAALRGIPGIQVTPNEHLGKSIIGRDGRFNPCPAVVVLDGMTLQPDDDVDAWVSPDRVAGMEVYADAMFAPPQYGNSRRDGCSVVLIWTR